jgi:hypothetical protein
MGDSEDSIKPTRFPVGALKRPRYQAGHYLAASDLATWQRYRLQRLRRHRRYLHGWGVVCGLRVVPAAEPERPWAVRVCPGYAIGPYGDEIEVATQVVIDLREYLWLQPPPLTYVPKFTTAFLGLRYVEQMRRSIPANVPSCGCEETSDKSSRIRDGFRIDVLWHPQLIDRLENFDPCEQISAPCPDCPDSPYILLACIKLPDSESEPINSNDIDNWTYRKQL